MKKLDRALERAANIERAQKKTMSPIDVKRRATGEQLAEEIERREKNPSGFDVFFSIVFPIFGIVVGPVAMLKGEVKRGAILFFLSSIIPVLSTLGKML